MFMSATLPSKQNFAVLSAPSLGWALLSTVAGAEAVAYGYLPLQHLWAVPLAVLLPTVCAYILSLVELTFNAGRPLANRFSRNSTWREPNGSLKSFVYKMFFNKGFRSELLAIWSFFLLLGSSCVWAVHG